MQRLALRLEGFSVREPRLEPLGEPSFLLPVDELPSGITQRGREARLSLPTLMPCSSGELETVCEGGRGSIIVFVPHGVTEALGGVVTCLRP